MWVTRNDGIGKRIWFLTNDSTGEYHENKRGELIRYTMAGAYAKASRLNNIDR